MSNNSKQNIHLRITGIVQGVFFRASMCEMAKKLSVTGWVRNRQDRSVEAVIQGEANAISEMINWAKVGPSSASVQNIESSTCSEPFYLDFKKRESK